MKTLSVRETAKVLGCSRQALYNALAEEKLTALKDQRGEWRISAKAVQSRAAARKLRKG